MDANNSRISDEKDTELSRRLLKALANDDFDEVRNIENERESLEQSANTIPASEAVGEPIKHKEDNDLYLPEDDDGPKIVFSDDDDDPIEDGRVDPREGLNLTNELEDPEPTQDKEHDPAQTPQQTEQEQPLQEDEHSPTHEKTVNEEPPADSPPTPQVNMVDADTTTLPSTSSDFNYEDAYDYDESNEEEKHNPLQKLMQWVVEDETGHRKWLVIGGAATLVALLVLVMILITGNKDDTQQATQPEVQANQEEQPSQQQASELPGIIQPVNVTTRCMNEDSNPASMFDPNNTTAWICQRAMGVDGVVAEIDFGKEVTVTQLSIVPGFDYLSNTGTNEWTNYRVVNRVAWQLDEDGKETVIQDITPAQGSEATKTLETPVKTRKIYMKVMGTQKSDPAAPDAAPGSPQDAFAVGKVTVTGTG